VTLAILVLFIGKGLNLRFAVLRDLNIPEPVVGGLLFSILFAVIHFSIIIGFLLNESLEEAGLKLPLFVTCLFAGMLISSFITTGMSKKFTWRYFTGINRNGHGQYDCCHAAIRAIIWPLLLYKRLILLVRVRVSYFICH